MTSLRNYTGNIRAPEFPPDLQWLNTDRRLTLAELRGKLVLLDFWTYGCINCLHILPDLERLEREFADALVVVGVHSAKFANEGEQDNLRRIVQRYEIAHPVVNDRDYAVWQAYAVRAWPTTILISPEGRVIGHHSGEGVYQALHELISEAIQAHEAKGTLRRGPLELVREAAPPTALSFPGKVLADAASDRLYIADTNHHRIVVTTLAGHVLDVIGAGRPGLRDGAFGEAELRQPQGMALDGDTLYVADTVNHALRAADLVTRAVRTVAGDGTLAYRQGPSDAASARLNSPWDLVRVGRMLFIAMAGTHQLWALHLDTGQIGPFAGSGREGLNDGPRHNATLAQPSGLTSDGERLFFADSEASAVRAVGWEPDDRVHTIIGQGLFEFGDVDGGWQEARLQHPLGVASHAGRLYVADTYNHRLKIVDPASATVRAWLGDGAPGWRDGAEPRFYEPGGLSGAGERLYVADTNNHVIRVVDLASATVATLALADPDGLLASGAVGSALSVLELPPQEVRPGQGRVRLLLALPAGLKLNRQAASRLVWQGDADGVVQIAPPDREALLADKPLPYDTPATFAIGGGVLRGELTLYYCEDEEALCLIHRVALAVPVTGSADSAHADISVPVVVPAPTL
jgi:thiol-disulfide isomerase/thioredoxin